MGQETDALEDQNMFLDADILEYKKLAQLNENEKKTKIKELKQKRQDIFDNISSSLDECDNIQQDFGSIKNIVQEMVGLFHEAKFTANVSRKMRYDDETHFNESNITSYLSELEEYISGLITINAYKKGDPNAAISSVPLDRLTMKEFVNKDLAIDAPVDHEIATDTQTAFGENEIGTHGDDNNYNIIYPKDLYNRYHELNQRGLIKPISSVHNKI